MSTTFILPESRSSTPESPPDLSDVPDTPLWEKTGGHRDYLARARSVRSRIYHHRRHLAVILIVLFAFVVWFAPPPSFWGQDNIRLRLPISPLRPLTAHAPHKATHDTPDPALWLRENSGNKFAVTNAPLRRLGESPKPRAALISLVRNQEIDGIVQSMTQLEYHWNRKYQYPWIFFNDEPFNDEFKRATQKFDKRQVLL